MDISAAHAKLFPGAKHNGSGNMAREQKNIIVLSKFSLSLFEQVGISQNIEVFLHRD